MRIALLLTALMLAPAAIAQQAAPSSERGSAPERMPSPATLVAEMRKGGYVLYLRHTLTDFTQSGDSRMKSYEDCAGQRNLNDRGRSDARAIGEAIGALGIPVGQVLASPFCRTVETAQLAFGRVEKWDAARYEPAVSDNPDSYAALRKLLSTRPKPATNMVVVSHGNPFFVMTGGVRLAEGETALLRPLDTKFELIARIRADQWPTLRAAAGH